MRPYLWGLRGERKVDDEKTIMDLGDANASHQIDQVDALERILDESEHELLLFVLGDQLVRFVLAPANRLFVLVTRLWQRSAN